MSRADIPAELDDVVREEAGGKPAWRTWLVRGFTLAFFAVVTVVLVHQARTIEWAAVGRTLRGYTSATLCTAAAIAACSYMVYAGFELVARRYSGHRLPVPLTGAVGAISYCFNLNLGVWLGGIGFRYRLYSKLGIDTATTARLYLSTLVTNWSGYLVVAGGVFGLYGLELPPQWELSDAGLRWIGLVLLVAAAGYLWASARARRRRWTVRGHEIELPRMGIAASQMTLGSANWMLMAGVIYTLLPQVMPAPAYGTILAALLLASIAGVVSHIPAGLGVLEAVFLSLLGHRIPHAELLGALLAYRAIYFIGPLMVAGVGYGLLEAHIKRRAESGTRS